LLVPVGCWQALIRIGGAYGVLASSSWVWLSLFFLSLVLTIQKRRGKGKFLTRGEI